MAIITLSSEDCDMIEKCVDMISMQCKMIANLLRRSRGATVAAAAVAGRDTRLESGVSDGSGEGTVDMLNNAMSALSSSVRQMSGDLGVRKRSRPSRPLYGLHGDGMDDGMAQDSAYMHATTTPPAVKRRGRPPRDYGDELGPAFAMYASEVYGKTMQEMVERMGAAAGTRLNKNDVLRAVWDSWWLSSQSMKDKYLSLARHEMAVNEANMMEILLDYPLPTDSPQTQSHGHGQGHSHGHSQGGGSGVRAAVAPMGGESPEPLNEAFDMYMREQVPLLRAKVPDWSDGEVQRRLMVNWNGMSASERERYVAAVRAKASTLRGEYAASRPMAHSAPRRAYVLFCRRERPRLVSENPEWDLPTVNKELGRLWKDMPAAARDEYHALERREAEQRTMARSGSAAAVAATRDGPAGYTQHAAYARPGGYFGVMSASSSASRGGPNPNKGPSRAYVFYSRLNRKQVTAAHPDWDLATINRELGRMWKVLTPEERQTWETRAAEGDTPSAASTPNHRASPAHTSQGLVPSPVPLPLPLAVGASQSAVASMPATPASETVTPTPTSASTAAVAAVYAPHEGADDSEAEDVDVDMHEDDGFDYDHEDQDDDATDDDSARLSMADVKVTPLAGPPATAKPAAVAPAATAAPASSMHVQLPLPVASAGAQSHTPDSQ
ncbi:hypothetical protein LPJ73_001427 [Coemansia sp. RSA 2703]|nr:hypothetical protein LPJ73_001427 [Coemansia sp. RSA 2703]KAJ2374968.1 hypothetical protein IW150_002811 [Coemansia sp. RSA 2607]KAJ2396831.1 hypothetical protein GGI05_000940 [Coemansia sp. RSA 2603]